MSAKEYEYWLPSSDGNDELHKTTHNSIILIGANGTGKSRLGVWMEKNIQKRFIALEHKDH